MYDGYWARRRKTDVVYKPYRSIYALERAYSAYINGWVLLNVTTVAQFRLLAMAELNRTYGVEIVSADQLIRLRETLRPLLEGRPEDMPWLSLTDEFQHAVDLFRVTETREGMRRVLGEASVMANLSLREEDLEHVGEMVVTVGTMVANYIDSVLATVTAQREELEKLLLGEVEQLFSVESVQLLRSVAGRLREVLVARTFTRVGKHAPLDCERAAETIERMIPVSESVQSGAFGGVHAMIRTAANSLKLLEAQYVLEQLISRVADLLLKQERAAQQNDSFAVDWESLKGWHGRVVQMIPERLGKGFKNDVVPDMLKHLVKAAAAINVRDLAGFKSEAIEASNKS